jgi:hypothetical protein
MITPEAAASAMRGALPLLGVTDTAAWLAAYTSALSAQPAPVAPQAGKYRNNQPLLFQAVSEKTLAPRLQGGKALLHDVYGPTAAYVDPQAGWPWDRNGGDWVDRNGVRYGEEPWFSVTTDRQAKDQPPKTYTVDVTATVQHCLQHDRWLALLLRSVTARTISGAGVSLLIEYEDGESVTQPHWCIAAVSSSVVPNTIADEFSLPLFVEFKRPTRPIKSAALAFQVTKHWSGSNTDIQGWLLDPPLNADPVQHGTGAGIQGRHDYADGTVLDDFLHPQAINHSDESHFDPAIFGGNSDKTKLPHRGLGKFILSSEDRANWSLVDSNYRGEGFEPLRRGLGAMRIHMADSGAVDGSTVGYMGGLAANGMIYLPEPAFGRQGRIFVRYYQRLGTPYDPRKAHRKQVRHATGGIPVWTTGAGKMGIGPDHSTAYGGVSGTSGGPFGWQMRGSWRDCDAEMGGPAEGGVYAGHHLYDYIGNNPAGHQYGNQHSMLERWGQRGGLGGVLYAGHWYCVETELKLNTISDTAPGFLPDGELRTWLDGRLVYQRTGMVFRSGPVSRPAYQQGRIRPARDLGIRGLWLNWFHGGKTWNTYPRTTFYSALAWGTEYIGPLRT